MGFFAKKKVIDYETEMSIPSFTIDPNGFVMFDDADLGGAAVLEVTPLVMTEGMTHEDPLHNNISTDADSYIPTVAGVFEDRRKSVYQPWVHFLNSLQTTDPSDDPIHIQILMKKSMADEWITRVDYAYYKTEQELKHILYPKRRRNGEKVTKGQKRREALLRERTRDYLDLLDFIKYDMEELSNVGSFDVRTLPTYTVKFYLIVSYTPTSEGWWMDGRDSDYYIADNVSATNMFKSDNMVEKITDRIMRRRNRKNLANSYDNEEELFWIASDRTAQVLDTRLRKIEKTIRDWNRSHERMPMPFKLRRLDGRESAALIRFFPNILTPYWDKIWNLRTNENDVLRNIDRNIAIATGNANRINRDADEIIRGNVRIQHTSEEHEAALAKYRGKSRKELQNIGGDYDDRTWTAERQEQREEEARIRKEHQLATDELWAGIDNTAIIADEDKTQTQLRNDFLNRYKNRTPTVEYTRFNKEIQDERNQKQWEQEQQANQQEQRKQRKQLQEQQKRSKNR